MKKNKKSFFECLKLIFKILFNCLEKEESIRSNSDAELTQSLVYIFQYDELSLLRKIKLKVFDVKFSEKEILNFYKNAISNIADMNGDWEMNPSPNHKSIFIEKMLSKAKKYVFIFDENLEMISSEDILNKLKSFIRHGGYLRVVLNNTLEESSEAILMIKKYHELFPLQVFMTKADPLMIQSWKALDPKGDLHYFIFSDDKMYWYLKFPEFEIGAACFNNPLKVAELKEIFKLLCN